MKLNYFIQGHQARQDGENCLQMTIDCKQKVQILARCQRKAIFPYLPNALDDHAVLLKVNLSIGLSKSVSQQIHLSQLSFRTICVHVYVRVSREISRTNESMMFNQK